MSQRGVQLIMQPGKTVTQAQFAKFPPYSIAVDGYCVGAPWSSPDCRRVNVNHHDGCDRLATRASCAQALQLVKMGLFETFTLNGRNRADVYMNDCDQDVQWTSYILKHADHVDRPRLKMMVQLADLLDASMGFYPIKKRWSLLKRLLWVSEPYTDARADGSLKDMDAEQMLALLEMTHRRIRATLFGGGKEVEPDTRFEVIEDFGSWQFINEIGAHARLGLAQKGVKAFVALVGPEADVRRGGSNRYVAIRRSRFIPFPLPKIFRKLNEAEGIEQDDPDRWNGADTGGGSPRKRGSKLRPEEALAVVQKCCDEYQLR